MLYIASTELIVIAIASRITLKGLRTLKRENSPTTMSIGLQFTVNSEERIDSLGVSSSLSLKSLDVWCRQQLEGKETQEATRLMGEPPHLQ